MMPETWTLVTILLLAFTALARGLALSGIRGPWNLAVTCSRVGAALALVVVLAQRVSTHGGWSPLDWEQLILSLSLAILILYQAMAWAFRTEGASPFVDLLTLALVVTGMLLASHGGAVPTCIQRAVPFYIQWGLFLTGAAAAAVMGSAGLLIGLQSGLGQRGQRARWPDQADLTFFLTQTTMLTLVALGSGLVLSICWAWQTTGSLSTGDPRVTWMAITWLIVAMSSVARWLEKRWVGWSAGLAVVAAASALYGLLAVTLLPILF